MSFPVGASPSRRTLKEFKQTKAVELYLQGYSQIEIEAKLTEMGYPADRSIISRYITDARKEWREKRMQDMDAILEKELAALEKMERDTAELFDRFKPFDDENDLDVFMASKEAAEWIKARLKIMEQRYKLLGLNKPIKLDVESKNENVNVNAEQSDAIRSEILSRLSPKSE